MWLLIVQALVVGGLAQYTPEPRTEDGLMEKSIDQTIQEALDSAIEPQAVAAFDDETVLVELDMLYDKQEWDEKMFMEENPAEASKRGYALDSTTTRSRWINNIVPYVLDNSWSSSDLATFEAVKADYHRWTCIQFKPRTNERNYIRMQDGNGCNSYVGVINRGMQKVNLAKYGCRSHHTISHELGHAVGFHHEQTRPDRDNYITVHFENITPKWHYAFNSKGRSSSYGVAYDYGSVMHYGETSFSSNRKKTIITKDPAWQRKIGKAPNLSFSDLKVANIIYKCAGNCGSKVCPSGGYLDKNCKCMCKGPSATDPVKECGCKKRKSIIDQL